MSVILVDLVNDQNDLQCNWWNWRPTLELMHRTGRLTDEQLERMGANGCGGKLSADEAIAIARFIESEIIPNLQDDEVINCNGRVFKQLSLPQSILEIKTDDLYAASKAWLKIFVEFCKSCRGFKVL